MASRLFARTRLVHALALGTAAAACGGGLVTGPWHGTTARGKTLSFTVDGNTMTQARLAYDVAGAGCSERVNATLTSLKVPIRNNSSSGTFDVGGLR